MSDAAHEIAMQIKKIDVYLESFDTFNSKIQTYKTCCYENEIEMLTDLHADMVRRREDYVKEFEAEFNKLSILKEDLIKQKNTREEMLNDPFMDHEFNAKLVQLFAENHSSLLEKIRKIETTS